MVADLDSDNDADIVLRQFSGLLVLLGDGIGGFPQQLASLSGGSFNSFLLAEVTCDGVLDAILSPFDAMISPTAKVLPGNNDGTFGPALPAFSTLDGTALAVADVDGDGDADFIVAGEISSSGGFLVQLGNDDGTFRSPAQFDTFFPEAIRLADMNNDTHLDVVTADSIDDEVAVLLGNGDGTLQPPQRFAAGIPFDIDERFQWGRRLRRCDAKRHNR